MWFFAGEFIRDLVSLKSGGSGGVVWRIRANSTKLVCAVGSRNGTEETKLMVLDFDVHDNNKKEWTSLSPFPLCYFQEYTILLAQTQIGKKYRLSSYKNRFTCRCSSALGFLDLETKRFSRYPSIWLYTSKFEYKTSSIVSSLCHAIKDDFFISEF